jgi:flotillin
MLELIPASAIIAIVVIAIIVIFLAVGYVKAPPDMAFIISGIKKKSKIVIGKAAIRIPFFERLDKLNLRLIPIDVKTSNAVPTADYININVDATVNVKISNESEKLRLAAENFLNKNTEYIAGVAREVLEGNVREIVGKMKLEEMVSDRQKFATLVKENAEPDLAAMGLDIISFNVQNFVDGNEVIENLGIDNIVKIKKAAAIARAESERSLRQRQTKNPMMQQLPHRQRSQRNRMNLQSSAPSYSRKQTRKRLWQMPLTRSRKRNSVRRSRSQLPTQILQNRNVRLSKTERGCS